MIVINENKRLGYNQEGRDTCGLSDTIKLEGYKLYTPDLNVKAVIDSDSGEARLWMEKTVTNDVNDENELSLTEHKN